MFLQMNELETLDYSGMAVAFGQENSIAVGTSNTSQCFTPVFTEYVHAVITAGKQKNNSKIPVQLNCFTLCLQQTRHQYRSPIDVLPRNLPTPKPLSTVPSLGIKYGQEKGQNHPLFLSSSSTM